VLLKPTNFKADEVLFNAYSPGGTSLVSDADYMTASNASAIMSLSGVGAFSSVDLSKKLAGKAAGAGASIGQTTEGMGGTASPKNLETLFQLIYLRFTAPRLDTAAWQSAKQRTEASLANRNASPATAFTDMLTATMTQNNFRSRPLSQAGLDEINPRRALEIYTERFANAGDFTFVFVGSISPDSLKPLVEKYIASRPSTGRVEKWKDVGAAPPSGVIEKVVRKGSEPRASTAIIFTGPFRYAPQSRFDLQALTIVAQIWLTNALREATGGTYAPSLNGGGSQVPRAEYSIAVQFSSSPDDADKLTKRTFAVIDSLKTTGPSDEDITKIKEQITRGREVSLKTNAYWVGNISSRDQASEPLDGLLGPYDEMVKRLTAAQIKAAANQYFNTKNYVKVVLLPEAPKS